LKENGNNARLEVKTKMAVSTHQNESNKELLLQGQTDSTSFKRMHKVEGQNKLDRRTIGK
jgi:hypothetical protein